MMNPIDETNWAPAKLADSGAVRKTPSSQKLKSSPRKWRILPPLVVGIQLLVGGFNPSEKYWSVGMMKFPIYGKIKHVRNHQPGYINIFGL